MCRQTTVPSSSHAAQNGSQWSLCRLGQPELLRVLRERDRVAALGRDPTDLVGHQLRVPDRRDRQRDEAPGVRAAPLVDVPVVVGADARRARGPCPRRARRAARRSAGTTGSSASRARRWRSCRGRARRRRSSPRASRRNASGSMPYSSGGRPATAFRPMFGARSSPNCQYSVAVVVGEHARRPVAVRVGDVHVEHVRRLDDVVVHADEDQVFKVHGDPPFRLVRC